MYDIVIIGGAPAGLTAALYGARQNNSVLIIEKDKAGGQTAKTNRIENYPGSDLVVSGEDLVEKMLDQAKNFGAELVNDEVVEVDLKKDIKIVKTKKDTYQARSVIIATGAHPRLLGVPGEEEFTGKGISYCATCDAPFFEGLDVYVVGGGNAAVDEAIYLSKFARRVKVLVRSDRLKCDAISKDKADSLDNIDFLYNTSVKEFRGEGLLKEMTLVDNKTGEEKLVKASEGDPTFGVFIFIGSVPNTGIFEGQLDLEGGYIPTDEKMRTQLNRVYAAGDVRTTPLRQIVTAAADGAIAAYYAGKDLTK